MTYYLQKSRDPKSPHGAMVMRDNHIRSWKMNFVTLSRRIHASPRRTYDVSDERIVRTLGRRKARPYIPDVRHSSGPAYSYDLLRSYARDIIGM